VPNDDRQPEGVAAFTLAGFLVIELVKEGVLGLEAAQRMVSDAAVAAGLGGRSDRATALLDRIVEALNAMREPAAAKDRPAVAARRRNRRP
jgi:hypothetical protein